MNAAWPSAQFFARFGSRAPDSGYDCFWRNAAIRLRADFSQVRHSIIRRTTGLSLLRLQAALSRLLTHP